jgi:copper transport protein
VLRSKPRRWVPAAAAACAALLAAAPAYAHSTLLSSDPANDAVVEQSPRQVVLRFDEPVETALGAVRVYDGSGKQVSADGIARPAPEQVAARIDGTLQRGTYTVTWRVISADSDPISGAFVFHVGAPGPQPSGIGAQVLKDTPFDVSALYLGGRFLDFALLLLCCGGTAALVLALRAAAEPLRRRLLAVVAWLACGLAVNALVGLPLQGAAAGGTGLGAAFTADVVTSVAGTRFGHYSLARAGLAVALAVVALVARRRGGRADDRALAAALPLVLALVFTPGLSGHASTIGAGSILADAAHVQAAAVWVGGLATVVLALILARERRWPLAAASVPRLSMMAVASVAVLLVAGAVNGYLQVRAWRALWETEYGLLLLAKIALVIPLLALGAYNNRYAVPRLRAQIASPLQRRRFLRFAGAELAIMVMIVGVTSALVNAPPARTEVRMHEPFATEAQIGPLEAHVSVVPGRAGRNDIHVEFMDEEPRVDELRVSATLASKGLGPLRYTARPGMEHAEFTVQAADLPLAGDWQLRLEARRGEFELFTETISVSIEKESR